MRELRSDLLQYAALDVFASRIIFEKASECVAPAKVDDGTPPGTRVVLLVQEGGIPAAYGEISDLQPPSWGGIRVKVANKNRALVRIDSLIIPSAAAILHRLPARDPGKTKTGSLTLKQLKDASNSTTFHVVAPISHLQLDTKNLVSLLTGVETTIFKHPLQDDVATTNSTFEPPETLAPAPEIVVHPPSHSDPQLHEDDSDDTLSEFEDAESLATIKEHESNHLKMLESHSQASLKSRGESS